LLQEVLPIFLDETPALLERLRRAVAAGEGDAVMRQAHSLKGSIANFGPTVTDLTNVAYALECAGRNKDTQNTATLFTQLEAGLEELYQKANLILVQITRQKGEQAV
jgi:HPt (histidine-containing phosphotransfer) domain-containing protein